MNHRCLESAYLRSLFSALQCDTFVYFCALQNALYVCVCRSFDLVGMTALLLALDADFSECVRELLYAGASPDGPYCWRDESEVGRTPLVVAMSNNCVDSIRLLLQAGCRLDIPSRTDDDEVVLPSELLATGRCTSTVERLVVTAASALGLQVTRRHWNCQLPVI